MLRAPCALPAARLPSLLLYYYLLFSVVSLVSTWKPLASLSTLTPSLVRSQELTAHEPVWSIGFHFYFLKVCFY